MPSEAGSGDGDCSPAIRYEIIRALLQRECIHPDYLLITDLYSQLEEYEPGEIKSVVTYMHNHLDQPVNFWDNDEDRVCLESSGLAESELQDLGEELQDRFP